MNASQRYTVEQREQALGKAKRELEQSVLASLHLKERIKQIAEDIKDMEGGYTNIEQIKRWLDYTPEKSLTNVVQ